MARRNGNGHLPNWMLTGMAAVAFLLWTAGWVGEFVSNLTNGSFHAPDGALPFLMMVVGGSLAADRLWQRGKKAVDAAAEALRDEEDPHA